MKRSDVVMMMAATMFNPPEHIRDMSDGGQQTIRMMDHILAQLEAIGMLPPEIVIDYSPLTTTNMWEKEND